MGRTPATTDFLNESREINRRSQGKGTNDAATTAMTTTPAAPLIATSSTRRRGIDRHAGQGRP